MLNQVCREPMSLLFFYMSLSYIDHTLMLPDIMYSEKYTVFMALMGKYRCSTGYPV